MSLKVVQVWLVSCTKCKQTGRYTDESQVPTICPYCMDRVEQEDCDPLEMARLRRMGGEATSVKHFKV